MAFIILNWNKEDDVAIMTTKDGKVKLFDNQKRAENYAIKNCYMSFKIVGLEQELYKEGRKVRCGCDSGLEWKGVPTCNYKDKVCKKCGGTGYKR